MLANLTKLWFTFLEGKKKNPCQNLFNQRPTRKNSKQAICTEEEQKKDQSDKYHESKINKEQKLTPNPSKNSTSKVT